MFVVVHYLSIVSKKVIERLLEVPIGKLEKRSAAFVILHDLHSLREVLQNVALKLGLVRNGFEEFMVA